ncbi:MAG: hypothetical protein ACRCTJ_01630 [Brevinema sp.]
MIFSIDKIDVSASTFGTFIKKQESSSLPDKVALNHKLNGSCTHRDLIDKVQRSWSKKVVSLGEISEKILKEMGQSSPSSSQISDLTKKIVDENRLNGDPAKVYIWKDQLGKLSTKILNELYTKRELTSDQKRDLEKGFYKVFEFDKFMFKINKDLFWNRFYQDSNDKRINEEARQAVGLSMDRLEDDKIFVVTKKGVDTIKVAYKYTDMDHISSEAEDRLKVIVMYFNYKCHKTQNNIVITDTKRTAKEQAKIVYNNVAIESGGVASSSMYKGNSGQFVEQELKKGTSKEEIINMLEAGIEAPNKIGIPQMINSKMDIFTGFNHVNASKNTCDIGIGSNPWAELDFISILSIFISHNKFLDSRTLPLGKGNEKNCHHLVILV